MSRSTLTAESIAIITPSFYRDFERCALLAESVVRYVPEAVHHYVLVDRADEALFSRIRGPRTHLVRNEDILPWWLRRVPFGRGAWASLKSLPVRGWIVQQLAKLSVNLAVNTDVYIFVDSDAFFVKPYDPWASIRDGKVPLFREQGEALRSEFNTRWHRAAAELLGLPEQRDYTTSYVGNAVYWRRHNLARLQRCIEEVKRGDWVAACCRQMVLSEYVTYGCFVEHVLGDASGHWFNSRSDAYAYWATEPLTEEALEKVREGLRPEHAVVMISAKSRTPEARIRRVFGGR